jgi:hypothetical protein
VALARDLVLEAWNPHRVVSIRCWGALSSRHELVKTVAGKVGALTWDAGGRHANEGGSFAMLEFVTPLRPARFQSRGENGSHREFACFVGTKTKRQCCIQASKGQSCFF